MRLRPARATRKINSQAWARYSLRKPRKNYIKALPHTSLLIFKMGVDKPDYGMKLILEAENDVQLRSNAIEAARQAANKYLEREIPGNYFFRVLTYPHNVLREKRMATGAGADRISQGMTLAFGKPTAVAARVSRGQALFEVKIPSEKKEIGYEALRRSKSKLSGLYKIIRQDLGNASAKAQGAAAVEAA
ncbi:MAG: 50S ribosomal protein L16 [Candidatus Micrarchaeia archaeon]